MNTSQTLGEALPAEMTRVRDKIIPMYIEIGLAGAPALVLIRHSLDLAAQAMAEGDLPAMIRAYKDLQEITG